MIARRGSFRFKVIRLLLPPLGTRASRSSRRRLALRAIALAGRLLAMALVALVATTVGIAVWRIAAQNYRLHQQIAAVERQNKALEADSKLLSREIELLRDPEYLVPYIHEQLGLTKPGEVIVQVATPSPPPRRK